jgi:thioredoxin 1
MATGRVVLRMLSLLASLLVAGWGGCSSLQTDSPDLGWVHRGVLDTSPYIAFRTGYDAYAVDTNLVTLIRQVNGGVETIIFFGAWCSDSKREVPCFLKIADYAGMSGERLRLYALDHSKKSADGLTDQYRIEQVPTFIFLRRGKEIGRIVEKPKTTIEGDLLALLAAAQQH